MRKFTLILLLSGLTSLLAFSQRDEDKVNFFDGIFFLEEEDYRDALSAFMKLYESGYKENTNINYLIGVSYLNINGEKVKAIPYLEKAVENISDNYRDGVFNETRAPLDALLFLGNAYRINYELDKAIDAFNRYIELLDDKDEVETKYALQQIEACERAKIAISDPANVQFENLGSSYNSGLDNHHAVVSGNEEHLAYVSEQKFYDAVYFVQRQGNNWGNPVNVTPQIQSDGDQYVSSLSYDGNTMFLTKISNFDADIMVSEYEARTWSRSENIGKPINSKFFESHATLSPDGKTLYFTSNRNESIGAMDIFYSELTEDGEWGEPVNMGDRINTSLNEDSPFITGDGNMLVFSSQGHSTIGGYDIFYSMRDENGVWSDPERLPYPLNTTDDDLFFFPTGGPERISGYITRYEQEGIGGGDIYHAEIIPVQEPIVETPPVPVKPEPETEMKDTVAVVPVPVTTDIPDTPQEEEKEVDRLRFNIRPVFFAFDSYRLTETAREKLDILAEAMFEYPQLKIEVHGHTDSKGPDNYNQILSERRAGEVIDYLVDKGIERNRFTPRAFSENKPAALNTTADGRDSVKGRMLNRRVEFRVTTKPVEWIELDEVEVPDELKISE